MNQALWSWLYFHSLIYKTGGKTKRLKKGHTVREPGASLEAQGPGWALGHLYLPWCLTQGQVHNQVLEN